MMQKAKIPLSTFIPNLKGNIEGYEPGHEAVPPVNSGYAFTVDKLRDFLAFWQAKSSCLRALKIQGDPATGKTSLVEQFHARVNVPLYKVACNERTLAGDLMGRLMPTAEGTLVWCDGPVTRAAREGSSVLLDEYNTLDSNQASGLNMLMEGYTFTIPETGEVITPHPSFRIFATENDVQSRLTVTGRNVGDAANDDRFMTVEADYLPADIETKIVYEAMLREKDPASAASPDVQAKYKAAAEMIVDVANRIRVAYRNEEDGIDKPMSTRSAIRWGCLQTLYSPSVPTGPARFTLPRAFKMSPEMRAAVDRMVQLYMTGDASQAI